MPSELLSNSKEGTEIEIRSRGKNILEKLSWPRFFPAFEISRSFLRAKQVEKRAENLKTREKSCL